LYSEEVKLSKRTEMIDIYPGYRSGSSNKLFFHNLNSIISHGVVPFFSGRSAMFAGLEAFGLTRVDEILVPPYLGHCVLSSISRTSFPTMTPSDRTKAILVYHQFGFPQQLDRIERVAHRNNWIILNDCASSLFTKVNGKFLIDWGDFTIVSFSKIYHCGLGGGLWTDRKDLLSPLSERSELDQEMAEEAFDFYLEIQSGRFGKKTHLKIQALYGLLPDIKSIAPMAVKALPASLSEIYGDIERRKRIYSAALDMFGINVPVCEGEVVPFAIPILWEEGNFLPIADKIQRCFNVSIPLLHFDFARNILEPEYKKALIIGCHDEWEEDIVYQIFSLIKKELL
jgi:hypothetical protein